MSPDNFSEVGIIIRSGGERTAPVCRHLISEVVSQERIEVVQKAPFTAALQDSFGKGIEMDRKWTLSLDGDILPSLGGLGNLIEFAERQPPQNLVCLGMVIDKLFGNRRPAGVHLYRTSLLPLLLEQLSAIDERALRPESELIARVKELGHGSAFLKEGTVGLHDYEQYYRDIYRKSFIHAKKNMEYIRLLIPAWEELRKEDPDFDIAVIGVRAGHAFPRSLPIDLRVLPSEVSPILECLNLPEKDELSLDSYSEDKIGGLISSFVPLKSSGLLQRRLGIRGDNSTNGKLRDLEEAVGAHRIIPWLIGSKLRQIGNILVNWAESGMK